MNAILAAIVIAVIPIAGLWVLHLFAFIAEYQENPVIGLVEELRKKHSNTNEN
jgi:hypothetical protein|nr:MAG TPA: hypothetical protein [Caudoviricetes sp.]